MNYSAILARILLGLVIFFCILYIWDKSQSKIYRIDAYKGSVHSHFHRRATSYSGALSGVKADSVKIIRLDK